MRMLGWPALSPCSASSRFPGGDAKSFKSVALSRSCSLRLALVTTSTGSRLLRPVINRIARELYVRWWPSGTETIGNIRVNLEKQ